MLISAQRSGITATLFRKPGKEVQTKERLVGRETIQINAREHRIEARVKETLDTWRAGPADDPR